MAAALRGATAAETAIAIVDLQNDFCAVGGYLQRHKGYDVGFADAVTTRIEALLAAARATGVHIVWIRSTYDFAHLPPAHITQRGEEGCCLEGTWGSEFYRLEPAPEDAVFTKHTFTGFRGTDLDAHLRARGIATVAFAGVATNVCVDSTLRDAFFRGYHVALLEDCVGSNNAAGHEGTLATVRTNFGVVTTSAQLVAELRDAVA